LIREKSKQQRLMDSAYGALEEGAARDRDVLERLKKTGTAPEQIPLLAEDEKKVFSLEAIRGICIRYRLRFLDTKHFRSEFPYEAILAINDFERKYGIRIESFRIVAPDRMFDLENINKDPLLFAQLSDGRYYFLHKWGEDLRWHRRLLAWPLQSFRNYFIALWGVCFLGSFLLPSSILHVLNPESEIYLRIWFMIHLFIGLSGVSLWLAFSYDKRFSDMQWDSKYYNY
jgi:hypothetical protein